MDQSRRVFSLVLIFIFLLLGFSILQYVFGWQWLPLKRINLVADVVTVPVDPDIAKALAAEDTIVVEKNGTLKEFSLYRKPRLITNFNADTSLPVLNVLAKNLHALKTGEKKKVRIAYFGDSMIEGDLITEELRRLLQANFGGEGIGFVAASSTDAGFRTTINHYASGWTDKNFKTESGTDQKLYISGHAFYSNNGYINMTDKTITDTTSLIEKSLICGPTNAQVMVNDIPVTVNAPALVNRIVLENNPSHSIKVNVNNNSIPVYGISFESASGVFVDNFSFRGISGVEFAKVDTALLHAVELSNAYDLIVVQYGVNVMYKPNDTNYNWYTRLMMPSVNKLRNAFAQSDMLLISAGDRAFRYGGEYKTAVGIDSLLKIQARIADSAHIAFYNLYESMGGNGTIVQWANEDPSLANKDYVHPNRRGALILGKEIYEAIMKDYSKYKISTKK